MKSRMYRICNRAWVVLGWSALLLLAAMLLITYVQQQQELKGAFLPDHPQYSDYMLGEVMRWLTGYAVALSVCVAVTARVSRVFFRPSDQAQPPA